MKLLIALVFGIVQGATEFLPISSGGHLALIQTVNQTVFGEAVFSPTLTFDILLRIGTLAAIVFVFFSDIRMLWKEFIACIRELFHKEFHLYTERPYRKLLYMLAVTMLFLMPAVLLNHWLPAYFSGLSMVAAALILTGVADVLIDQAGTLKKNGLFPRSKGEGSSSPLPTAPQPEGDGASDSSQLVMEKVLHIESGDRVFNHPKSYLKKAALVGVFQLFSLFPGLSRSGMTVLGGLFAGFRRDLAVRYAFLSAIPVLVAKILMQSVTVLQDGICMDWLPYLLGMLAAFISGGISIGWMRKAVRKHYCKRFGIYCFFIGIVIIMIQIRG